MTAYAFYQLDVFTDTPLFGNPLAVFPDPGDLTPEQMQAIAREMNLSETTYVLAPSSRATKRVRFFTPTAELPLAGHPTIGTWWKLAEMGTLDIPADGICRVTQETGRGVLPVDIHMSSGKPTEVVMVQPLPAFEETSIDADELAAALGGNSGLVSEPAPQVVTTALPQLMVPIRSLEDLKALPSGGAGARLAQTLRTVGTDCAMCYTSETEDANATVHCRMFAPGLGVPEDPATGSAAGALGSYLVWHGLVRPHNGVASMIVEQGIEIGRPSRIHVEISVGNGGEITEVRVGGQAVTVIHGEVQL
jgi:trans-2,3-dihydro-3-hydroxyanthranilate isomerase